MSLFYDDHSDEAYLVRSVRNQFAGISKLTDDFSKLTTILVYFLKSLVPYFHLSCIVLT